MMKIQMMKSPENNEINVPAQSVTDECISKPEIIQNSINYDKDIQI